MSESIDLAAISARESEQVEWKENVADIDDVVATLSAFANDLQNLGGGYVVCGAKETKDESGFPRLEKIGLDAARLRQVEGMVLTRCRERVSPPITPRVSELPGATADRRILVFTQPATEQAHTCRRGDDGGKHWVRISRTTIEARNGILLNLLVRKGVQLPWDRRPCASATVADLDLLALRDALERMGIFSASRGVEPYLDDGVELSPFVPSLCVAEPLTGVRRPRNYAILLFGRQPQKHIPGAFCIFSRYPGSDRSGPVAERSELAGTLLDQARRLQELLSHELTTLFDKTNLKEPNAHKYPQRALQEAMVNALAHRDYLAVDPTRITAFADRLEFVSPGALAPGVHIEDFRDGAVTPRWRNQSLAWFLSRLQLAQAEGQGILTIQKTMQANGCPPPIFAATEAFVRCTLPAHPRFTGSGVVKPGSGKRTRKPRGPRVS